MSLLNPATAYRRSTNRPRVPVVLPLVRVDVDNHGHLAVTVDEAPFPDIGAGEVSTLSPADLRPLLDRIAVEHGSALRVEIHEPDGKVFTDFHTPRPAGADKPTAPSAPTPAQDAAAPRTTLYARIASGEVTGTGFTRDEEVAVAVVIYRHRAETDGTIELQLPVALLERHGADVMLVGANSGAVNVTPPKALEPVREAS